ncbi:hypothetical protein OV450_5708 [Actinobacteria bacterium OV450]|nr:hypothetical protein OV450_5708 [Actinobacteria bacterium OV450]
MSPSTTSQRPHTREMVLLHRAFRRESALLSRLVRTVPQGATARAARVGADPAAYTAVGLRQYASSGRALRAPFFELDGGAAR